MSTKVFVADNIPLLKLEPSVNQLIEVAKNQGFNKVIETHFFPIEYSRNISAGNKAQMRLYDVIIVCVNTNIVKASNGEEFQVIGGASGGNLS